jgi:hypothetical protein
MVHRTALLLAGLFMLAGALRVALARSGAQPTRIQNEWFALRADQSEWTASGLVAEGGDLVVLMVEGAVSVGPSGTKRSAEGALRNDGLGGVSFRIGDGSFSRVGAQRAFFAPRGGPLRFRVLDTHHKDNEGEYIIKIVRVPAALIPPATSVSDRR